MSCNKNNYVWSGCKPDPDSNEGSKLSYIPSSLSSYPAMISSFNTIANTSNITGTGQIIGEDDDVIFVSSSKDPIAWIDLTVDNESKQSISDSSQTDDRKS